MLFIYFFSLLALSYSEDIYENSSLICEKCKCTNSETFILDCSNKALINMLANWPTEKPIKAIFNRNNFTTLERLPATDAFVQVVLSSCNIKFLEAAVFSASLNIRYVDLSNNNLTSDELTSDKFRGPYKNNKPENLALETLNLAYNQIHTLYKDVFKYLPNLTTLNLEGNNLKVLDIHSQIAIGSIKQLAFLNLANNQLTDLVEDAIRNLQNLIELNLSENQLDFVPSSLQTVGKSLQILKINENPIIKIDNTSFSNLPNLIEISANNLTKLKEIESGAFTKNVNLIKLSLRNNAMLETIQPNAFSIDLVITELYLNDNNLSDLNLNLNWSGIDILNIKTNPFICSCGLYNLSNALSGEIKRNKDGPTCLDPTTMLPLEIYSLKSDICKAKMLRFGRMRYHRFSIPLVILIVTLMISILAAISLARSRYRKFLNGKNGLYVSQVMYSPLLNTHSRS